MNIIIAGQKHAGKTTVAKKLIEQLRKAGIPVGGFLCEGPRIADLLTGEQRLFLYRPPLEDAQLTGPFAIPNSAIRFGEEAARTALGKGMRACIDEYGKLELQGRGFHPLVEECMPSGRCIVLVRDLNLDAFLERFKDHPSQIYTVTNENRDALANQIYKESII